LSKDAKDTIKMLSDRQNSKAARMKESLIKQANDLIGTFQRDSRVTANSFSNLIGNLNRIQADFAKQEGIEQANQYFEEMKDGTF